MRIEFQRKVDRLVGIVLCSVFSLLSRCRRSVPKETKPVKILVILLSEMGSLVLARPMLDRIRGKYPDASVHVLLFAQNKEFLEVLDVIPADRILTLRNDSLVHFIRDSVRVFIQMRRIRIDTVLDCELFARVSSIYAFLSGARLLVGFHPHTQEGLYRGHFINRPVLYNPYQHISEQFINLVEAIASEGRPRVKRKVVSSASSRITTPGGTASRFTVPRMKVRPNEVEKARARFLGDFPNLSGSRQVLIYPGGGLLPIRAWPLESYCSVASDLLRNDCNVGVIGLESDKDLARTIQSHCKNRNCIDLTGYTATVRHLMLIFHFSSLLITNDGGPGHFASMTPLPTIVLYGPETPVLYGPLGNNSYSFHASFSCSPCLTAYNHRNTPCDGNNLCLKSISPEEVLSKAYEMLEAGNRHRDGTP